MTPRRLYGPVVLATLAVGGAIVLAAGRPWASTRVQAAGVPDDVVTVTGNQAVPLVAALGLVVVTGALAVLATRGRVRRAVGVLVTALGVASAILAATASGATSDALADAISASPSFTGGNVPGGQDLTWWRWATAGCGVLAAALGVLVVMLSPRWPTMGGRYDAPQAARRENDDDLWKALDEGRDPTE
ncbi:Trp biosynthesis-associated membrane protein [Aeromicrobium sp. CF4.19]|uniref:Trp biosynthesis-associated membrane protein n=1 Tax=Aeromicrobium sp. CF4.19 TaxID=3373082 RepID=UPI003EE4A45F